MLSKTPKNQKTKTLSKSSTPIVWKFTNGKELTKSEFTNYFERKVFRTIRKFKSLPKDKIFILKKAEDLNTLVLKKILETKFQVKLIPTTYHLPPNTSSNNLSQDAENIFKKIIKGNFDNEEITNSPLIHLSDAEVKLYASLKGIKGIERKQNKKIQNLFNKFLPKNQDLEINIQKAQNQINESRKR
jgi:hypothetical protein